jgi:hypothetical protein
MLSGSEFDDIGRQVDPACRFLAKSPLCRGLSGPISSTDTAFHRGGYTLDQGWGSHDPYATKI